jgi:hypothetical protein
MSAGTATDLSASAISGKTLVTAVGADHLLVFDATDSTLKKALISDVIEQATTEEVQDIAGAMFTSNTETGITATYQDADGTIDLVVGTLNQNTTGSAATLTTARTIGGTSFDGSANIAVATATEGTNVTVVANNSTDETVYPTFVDGATGTQGIETDTGLTYNPSTGMLTSTGLTGTLTGNVTGNVTGNTSGTALTVTQAAQTAITSVGTLTSFRSTGIDDNADALAITIDSSERVGINNSAMSSMDNGKNNLVVGSGSGGQGMTIYSANNAFGAIAFADGTSGDDIYRGLVAYNHAADSLDFYTNAAEKMTILSDGKVGIGTTSPTQTLDVAGIIAENNIPTRSRAIAMAMVWG